MTVAAIVSRNGCFLALTIPVALVIGISGVLGPASVEVEASREISSKRILAGEDVKVKIKVVNRGNNAQLLEVSDGVPGAASPRGASKACVYAKPGEASDFEYYLKFDIRGYYEVGPLEVASTDPLSLFTAKVKVLGKEEIVVFPKFEDIRGLWLRPKRTAVWPGSIPSKRSGRGTEFYGIREYVTGDELRRINWKASARLNRLVSNEFEEERVTDVLIVVDASGKRVLGSLVNEIVEAEVSAAASIALYLLKMGNRVGLVARGSSSQWIKPDFGRRQFLRILYYLAGLEGGEGAPNLSYILHTLAPYLLRPEAQIILITPLLEKDVLRAVEELSREYMLIVLSPNPFCGERGEGVKKVALKIFEVERGNLILRLSRICTVIDWDPTSPLTPYLRRAKLHRVRVAR